MGNLTLGSLFSGVGGIELGFKNQNVKLDWAIEYDKYACETHRHNFPDSKLYFDDIRNIDGSNLNKVDIVSLGFPCQPFSIAGKLGGFSDPRGELFFKAISLIKSLPTLPKVILIENVKNLKSHNNGESLKLVIESLTQIGFLTKIKVINSSSVGNTPQNRERIYILGFLDKRAFDRFIWPKNIELTRTLKRVIKYSEIVDERYYYKDDSKYIGMIKKIKTSNDNVFQIRRIYARENKNSLSPTLTANMGTGGHNVPIIYTSNGRFRKFTPRECFKLQGFPSDFILPTTVPITQLYKQAGNSVSVSVISRIAENIVDAL